MHFTIVEKQEQTKSQTSRLSDIIKIRTTINEIETKKLYKELRKQKLVLQKH
jgi:hypothetical protein